MRRLLLTTLLCLAGPALAVAEPPPVAAASMPTVPSMPAARLDAPIPGLTDGPASGDPAALESPAYLLFKTLVVLGIVVAIIYLTLNVGARRLLQLAPSSAGLVQVVERLPLDAKKSLFVVSVAGEYLLVGSTEAGLSLLSKLPADAVQQSLARRDTARAEAATFLQKLQSLAPTTRKPPG
jgi:flagellar protein FliO/FliZ